MSIPAQLRTLIVDDEELARALLREHLLPHREFQVTGECGNGFDAVKAINETKPDLVFLDIQMPKLDGFEVLELLDHQPSIVFVTAHDEFALRAFEVHAVDYLLKPFRRERFDAAVLRVLERMRNPRRDYREVTDSARPPGAYTERIVVRDGAKLHVVPMDRVDYFRAEDDYIAIHTGGKELLKQQTLSSLEKRLNPSQFVRVHRSAIVNIQRIVRIEPYSKDSKMVLLSTGAQIPVSKSGLEALERALG